MRCSGGAETGNAMIGGDATGQLVVVVQLWRVAHPITARAGLCIIERNLCSRGGVIVFARNGCSQCSVVAVCVSAGRFRPGGRFTRFVFQRISR